MDVSVRISAAHHAPRRGQPGRALLLPPSVAEPRKGRGKTASLLAGQTKERAPRGQAKLRLPGKNGRRQGQGAGVDFSPKEFRLPKGSSRVATLQSGRFPSRDPPFAHPLRPLASADGGRRRPAASGARPVGSRGRAALGVAGRGARPRPRREPQPLRLRAGPHGGGRGVGGQRAGGHHPSVHQRCSVPERRILLPRHLQRLGRHPSGGPRLAHWLRLGGARRPAPRAWPTGQAADGLAPPHCLGHPGAGGAPGEGRPH